MSIRDVKDQMFNVGLCALLCLLKWAKIPAQPFVCITHSSLFMDLRQQCRLISRGEVQHQKGYRKDINTQLNIPETIQTFAIP